MINNTKGIVLQTCKYNDTFSIVHIYTRDFGRIAYLLPKKSSKKSQLKHSLFFPLSILSLHVEHLPLREIQRLKSAEMTTPQLQMCSNPSKIAISFFLSEFIGKVVKETEENKLLYDFIDNSIHKLETCEKGTANFHLAFMMQMMRFIGIEPNLSDYCNGNYFDMIQGVYISGLPVHNHYLDQERSRFLNDFYRFNFNNMHLFKFSRDNRNEIIDYLIDYYRIHTYNFSSLKSLDVLKQLI